VSEFDEYFGAHALPELRRLHGNTVRARTQLSGHWGEWITIPGALVSTEGLEGIGEVAARTSFRVSFPRSLMPQRPAQIEIDGVVRRVAGEEDDDLARSPDEWDLYVA